MNWVKRIVGFVVTVITPYVATRYGEGAAVVVGTVGAAVVHQADKFGRK